VISLVLANFFGYFVKLFLRKTHNFKITKNWSAEYVSSLQNIYFWDHLCEIKKFEKKKKKREN
jgi:hypothetical protein